MAMNQEYINETVAQTAAVAAKAVVQAILAERRDGDECTMCRGDETGVRPKLGRPSPSYTFTDEVMDIYHTHKVAKAENIHLVKNLLGRQAVIQAEQEKDNETVKSLQMEN